MIALFTMGNIFKKEKQVITVTKVTTLHGARKEIPKQNNTNYNTNYDICDKIGCSKKGKYYRNGVYCFCSEHKNTLNEMPMIY